MTTATQAAPAITEVERLLRSWAAGIYGLLIDYADRFEAAGGRIVNDRWAVLPDGLAYPILCGDLVWDYDEDGRFDTRCGGRATHDGACEGHAAERDAWLELSEPERVMIERMEDECA
jgi:hypothetical protein